MRSALIVEDDPCVRLMLLKTLGRHGWWVDAVDSVECALALLDELPRDVALIDCQIGSDSGLSLLMAIKDHPGWQFMPVVMMHDGATLEEVELVFECGATDFLPKPFTGAGALKKLERWVIDRAGQAEFDLLG